MIKEEILAVEAGRELDRLVAIEVMDYERPVEVEPYSTDLIAAWQVVRKIYRELMALR